jgi:hypothetical protein
MTVATTKAASERAGQRSARARGPHRALLGTGVAAVSACALALSCSGPVPNTCGELATCASAGAHDAGMAHVDAVADVGTDSIGCDLSQGPKDEPCVLDDAYGVFVASDVVASDGGTGDAGMDDGGAADAGVADEGAVDAGAAEAGAAGAEPEGGGGPSASGNGSMAVPFATIAQALANLGGRTRIFVCNGLYAEQVSVATAVSIYGGLSCATSPTGRTWSYVGGSAQVVSPSPTYALSVTGIEAGAVTIEDVSFTAPNAGAPGGSSLGAQVASSTVSFARVTLAAGQGAAGAPGASGSATANYTGSAPAGGAQQWTETGGVVFATSGGAGGVNQCVVGSSAGGHGGLSCTSGLGAPGTASPPASPATPGRDGLPMGTVLGDGGAGTTVSANDPGADGVAGDGGAAAQTYGTLSPSGWSPSAGGAGAVGDPGQGGAGATDPQYGACVAAPVSLGGGGGGAGGCGGAAGQGGVGGGASIALASVGSTISLADCALVAMAAGAGGTGGAGQDGQAGAPGGDTSSVINPHAAGGSGGDGAGGSGGAGGTGGISVGILSTMSTITADPSTDANIQVGPPGAGGVAGSGGASASSEAASHGESGAAGRAGTSVATLVLM